MATQDNKTVRIFRVLCHRRPADELQGALHELQETRRTDWLDFAHNSIDAGTHTRAGRLYPPAYDVYVWMAGNSGRA